MEPGAFERSRRHFSDRRHGVLTAKGAERFFRPRADIRIARVQRRVNPRQYEEGDQVRLVQDVRVAIRGEVATVPDISEARVKDQCTAGRAAVLDQLVLGDRGHVIGPATPYGKEHLILLAKKPRAQERWLDQELRDVRS